jgi:hypothetical protein
MGRRAHLQSTLTKGELDPDLSERVDLEHYYDSAASAPNCRFHPQGGVSDRGGFALVSDADVLASGTRRRLRRRMVPLALTADNLTANNGGNTLTLVDQSTATVFETNAVTATPFVACEIDLGFAQYVDAIDLIEFRAELAGADAAIGVQYWAGASWVDFADPVDPSPRKHIRTGARTRRLSTAPGGPGGIRVAARSWRIIIHAGAGVIGRVSIGGLRLWQETAALGAIDVVEVARSTTESYELVITERNIDVFEGQRYVASVPTPIADAQIAELAFSGGFDTLIVFHEMLATPRITRQGSAGEWNVDALPFTNVPQLKAQIVFTGAQDEIQDIALAGVEAGDQLFLAFGDQIAGPVVYASAAAVPAQIAAALGSLPGVDPAGLAVSLVDAAVPSVRVRWTGANGNRAWPLLTLLTAATGVAATTRVVQPGLKAAGKLFEAETGWPRCGTFAGQRLVIGGFRAAPTSLMFARPDTFDFLDTAGVMTADLAFIRTLNVDGIETISSIFVGRHLQVFTESAEWYVATNVFDALQPTPLIRATGHGIRRAVPIAFADGGSLFVQQGGQTLRDFLWRDAEQSYQAEPLSVLSPQILKDVIDVAHRSARSVTEGNLVLLVNSDGSAGCLTLLRGQNVIAGSPWTIAGKFLATMCDVTHTLYAVIEHAGERWLERWVPGMPLDHATTLAGPGLTAVTGAHHLEGRSDVWAFADGELVGPFTVAGGAFVLGVSAASVTYGLLPDWRLRLQPVRARVNAEMPFRPPGRIYEVEVAVRNTGHLTLGTNGGAHRELPLVRLGDAFEDGGPLQTETGGAPGLPMLQRLYTGNVRVQGLMGFSRSPYVELGRSVPSPVHIKSIRYEMVMKDG